MKKIKKLLCISVCTAILLSLSACVSEEDSETPGSGTSTPTSSQAPETDENSVNTSDTEKNDENTSSEQKIPEGAPELVLLDGNKAAEDVIVKCTVNSDSAGGDTYLYEVNTVFAYPSGTSNADRNSENGSIATKLNEGSKWGDFTVTKTEAAYIIPSTLSSGVSYQYLGLKGNISFECKADYLSVERNILQIVLDIPEEAVKDLPSLEPYDNFVDTIDDNDSCRRFILNPDSELSKKITEKLEAREEVTVFLSAEEFEIRYTYFGLATDGATIGYLDDVTDFEIK